MFSLRENISDLAFVGLNSTNQVAAQCDNLSKSVLKIVSEYDQEIPQSQAADNPVAPRGKAAQPLRDTRKTN